MPSFCVSCGAPVNGAFCSNCGQRIQTGQPADQPPTAAAGPKKGGAAKALLITGGVLFVLFAIAVGAVGYGVYWVKNRAMAKISTYTGGVVGGAAREVRVARGQACSLLSRDDLAQALGIVVEKSAEIMEGSEPGCAYYTNSQAFAELQRVAMEQARKDSAVASQDKSLDKTDNPLALLKHTKEMEGIVKTLVLSQADKEGRVFAFTIDRSFGRENWSTLRATMAVVPGFEEISGVGDRAMIASFGHALYVLKGDSMINLELTSVPEARSRGAEIGRRIASRL